MRGHEAAEKESDEKAIAFGMHIAAGIFEDENQVRGLYEAFKNKKHDKRK